MEAQADQMAYKEDLAAQLEADEHRDLLKPINVDYGD